MASNSEDLSEEQVADLKEAFAMFDLNGDGQSSSHTTLDDTSTKLTHPKMMKSGDRSVERRRTRKRKRSVCGVLTAAATCFLTVAFPDATFAFVSRYVPFHGRLAASRTSGLPSEGRASLTEENETSTWIRGDQTHLTRMEQPAKDEESTIEDCSTLPEQNDYEPENSIIEASDPLSAQSFAVTGCLDSGVLTTV